MLSATSVLPPIHPSIHLPIRPPIHPAVQPAVQPASQLSCIPASPRLDSDSGTEDLLMYMGCMTRMHPSNYVPTDGLDQSPMTHRHCLWRGSALLCFCKASLKASAISATQGEEGLQCDESRDRLTQEYVIFPARIAQASAGS
ncbi:hypothetical protein MSAN_02248900 [Mycena sanguinolenta]|uniref:Uncharacterized protein n=1 Tax=Mycena sanguinolenta TaxID=230812 RepID=A0A8H7CIQ4_9AGAR|nr:hypothetical protein MSAN_02248900 [Mycena sanguinolenta]